MFFLRQILPLFVMPVGVAAMLIVAGAIWRRRGLMWAAAAVVLISSMPVVSGGLVRATEGWTERIPAASAPSADAIVVLSEGRVIAPGRAGISEWSDSDRFFGGVELFRAGKAPILIFTGGWTPGTPGATLEGDVLRRYAVLMGVPPDRILTTTIATNTAEEAAAVRASLQLQTPAVKRILLVTSAYHMTRALRLFERTNLVVLPFPVDFQVAADPGFRVVGLIPSVGTLGATQAALRELYGRLFYRIADLW